MDIRGNFAYLTVSEQIRSELSSPIGIHEFDVMRSYVASRMLYLSAQEDFNADPNEGLPHERASALRDLGVYSARSDIYQKIASELILRGDLDPKAIEDIR